MVRAVCDKWKKLLGRRWFMVGGALIKVFHQSFDYGARQFFRNDKFQIYKLLV